MTAEDKIHWGLLAALALLVGALRVGSPGSPEGAAGPAASPAPEPSAPTQVTRAELDASIGRLEQRVAAAGAADRDPLGLSLALQGLGQRGLLPPPSAGELAALFSRPAPSAAEDDPIAALAIALEGGLPLDRELPLASGTLSVRQLVERSLQAPARAEPGEPDAWRLELLSLASLRGMSPDPQRLAHLTRAALQYLDLRSRDNPTRPGSGALDADALLERAERWRAGESTPPARGLLLSLAAFRAVGVLADAELELPARRHLQRLLSRYRPDRAFYGQLSATAATPAERARAQLEAIEYFGRLEQALYGAHLIFRREQRPEPRIGAVMRQAASDLIEHQQGLERAGVFELAPASSLGRSARLRATVHALRGLRIARSATGAAEGATGAGPSSGGAGAPGVITARGSDGHEQPPP